MKYLKNFIKESIDIPQDVKSQMCRVHVKYIGFDGITKSGHIICNKIIAEDLHEIFLHLIGIKFPIYSIIPISEFGWDDKKSVAANNTSCFNWRFVIGSDKISDHALGLAIDINPMQNPWVHPSAHVIPGRKYDESQRGTISKNSEVVEIFKSYGFGWGGDWKNPDYQHFFKSNQEIKNKIIGFLK